MKTLINKRNPQIRITAPEIEEITTLGYTNYEIAREGMFPLLFNPKEWALIEEEPVKESVEHIRKDLVVDAIKLAYGKVSMNPFDCSEAFEELLDKVGYEIH